MEAGKNQRIPKLWMWFEGVRNDDGCQVTVHSSHADEHYTLPLFLNIVNHSPTGFEWGYTGSGPAQLAAAILTAYLGDKDTVIRLHQAFKFDIVSRLLRQKWTLTGQQIEEWLKTQEGSNESV